MPYIYSQVHQGTTTVLDRTTRRIVNAMAYRQGVTGSDNFDQVHQGTTTVLDRTTRRIVNAMAYRQGVQRNLPEWKGGGGVGVDDSIFTKFCTVVRVFIYVHVLQTEMST